MVVIGVVLAAGLVSAFYLRAGTHNQLASGPDDRPTYDPGEDCHWVKTNFPKAGLTAFIDDCTSGIPMSFRDALGEIDGVRQLDGGVGFSIKVFKKDPKQSPSDIIEKYYALLAPDQRKACEIQNEDEPLEYFSDGALAGHPMNEGDPHPTPHKTRLNIYLRKSTQNIIEANDGIGDPKYNFLCGNLMGSYLEARPPYLEFDDRTPDKYLFVSSRGQDDPPIDLNSLRF